MSGPATRDRPVLYLMVGLPGTGKTTTARWLEADHDALRLTGDDWVKALYGDDNPESARSVIEGRLIAIALRTLELGRSVVLDFGLWSRDERSALRQAALDRCAHVVMHYVALDPAEQRRRIRRRQTTDPQATWPMSEDELEHWAAIFEEPTPGELDGTEPIDPPPAGFATWEDWRDSCWPPTVR